MTRAEKGQDFLQQNSDPEHMVILTGKWLSGPGLIDLDWPPQFIDLNSIEYLWSELKKGLRNLEKQLSNLGELWSAVGEEYNSIPSNFCFKLINTMPERRSAVLKAMV